jgi:hypothetical protein
MHLWRSHAERGRFSIFNSCERSVTMSRVAIGSGVWSLSLAALLALALRPADGGCRVMTPGEAAALFGGANVCTNNTTCAQNGQCTDMATGTCAGIVMQAMCPTSFEDTGSTNFDCLGSQLGQKCLEDPDDTVECRTVWQCRWNLTDGVCESGAPTHIFAPRSCVSGPGTC